MDFTFIFTAINLIVLYLILKKILFKRVTNFMEERENVIAQTIKDGETLKAEGEVFKLEYEEKLTRAVAEIEELMKSAVLKANMESETIIGKAKAYAELILENAQDEIQREKSEMLAEVKADVLTLTIAAASRLLSKNVDTEENKVLIEEFLNDEGAA